MSTEKAMTIEQWLGEDNKIGLDIWNRKYRHDEESFDQWLERISGGDDDLKDIIRDKKFLFGGRILATRGVNDGTKYSYSNCYVVSPPEDNLESIYDTCKKLARTYSWGGGCGIDISKLAPEGAHVHNQAKTSSGAVSFMDTFSQVTQQIGQKGRRGALMISLDCRHPDLEKFITAKTDLNKVNYANISVRVSDDFMHAVENDLDWDLSFERDETGEKISRTVKAKDVFRLLCESNWNYAEPGILFWDTINDYNLQSMNPKFSYAGTNPCLTGDTLISTTKGRIPIRDLVGQTPEVYCVDDDGKIIVRKASKVWKTRENARIITVHTIASYIRCTHDHLVQTVGRGWVKAKDLGYGFRVLSVDTYHKPGDTPSAHGVCSVIDEGLTEDVYDMTVPDVHNFVANGMVVHNCAEEPLPDSGSCLLGSLNLAAFVKKGEFDYKDFIHCVKAAVRALNDVQREGEDKHPLNEQRECAKRWRQIGLGIMGLADMLIKMGIRYGSSESIDICDEIGTCLATTALDGSADYAIRHGAYPEWSQSVMQSKFFMKHVLQTTPRWLKIKAHGLANSQILTIAPTGTLSTMLGISGGIEPIFANSYTRTTKTLHDGKDVTYKIYTPIVKEYMEIKGIKDEADLPEFFITAPEIPVSERIMMQTVWQDHIDASISSTINLPHEATVEDVENIYMLAWRNGLKGITVYRSGCAREGILQSDKDVTEHKKYEELRTVQVKNVGLERHLTTGCGSLHVCAFFDEHGNLRNTYLSKGSTGGCNNFMIGLSRMISLAARSGVDIKEIADQLHSCGSCPSYAVRRATRHDTSEGSCCPVAIGNALLDMWKEINGGEKVSEVVTAASCPECGGELKHEMGCVTCTNCGYSKCG